MQRLIFGLSAVGLAGFMSTAAHAVILDGRYTADDNYTAAFALDATSGTDLLNGGVLRLGLDGTTGQYAAHLTVPTAFVDNKYGLPADDPASGWKKGHSFKDLLGSDDLSFTLSNGTTQEEIEIDYINDNDVAELKKGAGVITGVASSLQWNLGNVSGDKENSADPLTTLWEDALQYEFLIDSAFLAPGSAFSLANFSGFDIHASPKKTKSSLVVSCIDTNSCLTMTSSSSSSGGEGGSSSSSSGGGKVPAPGGLAMLLPLAAFFARRGARKDSDRASR